MAPPLLATLALDVLDLAPVAVGITSGMVVRQSSLTANRNQRKKNGKKKTTKPAPANIEASERQGANEQ